MSQELFDVFSFNLIRIHEQKSNDSNGQFQYVSKFKFSRSMCNLNCLTQQPYINIKQIHYWFTVQTRV